MTAVLSLVVAMSDNRVIGRGGTLPWRIPEDLRHFKAVTMGKPCIMGRKTWDSLPRKPLPGRSNIVITRRADFSAQGAVVVASLADAIAHGQGESPSEICVIGGAEVFAHALPLARRVYLTEVHAQVEGDVFMPPLDPAEWTEVAREDHLAGAPDYLDFRFITLEWRRAIG
jgi:dihydrofolate reductase